MDRIRCDCAVGFIFDNIDYTVGVRKKFTMVLAKLLAMQKWDSLGQIVL